MSPLAGLELGGRDGLSLLEIIYLKKLDLELKMPQKPRKGRHLISLWRKPQAVRGDILLACGVSLKP